MLSIEELSSIAIKVYLKEARGAKRNSTAFTLPGDDSTTASGRAAQPSSATPAIAIHPSGSSDSLLDSTAGSRSVADSSVGVAASAAAVVGVATADGTSLTMTEDGGGEGEGEGEGRSANTGTRSKDSITTPSQDTIQVCLFSIHLTTHWGEFWNKIHSSKYRIDSEMQFCHSRSYFLIKFW